MTNDNYCPPRCHGAVERLQDPADVPRGPDRRREDVAPDSHPPLNAVPPRQCRGDPLTPIRAQAQPVAKDLAAGPAVLLADRGGHHVTLRRVDAFLWCTFRVVFVRTFTGWVVWCTFVVVFVLNVAVAFRVSFVIVYYFLQSVFCFVLFCFVLGFFGVAFLAIGCDRSGIIDQLIGGTFCCTNCQNKDPKRLYII